MEVTTMSDETKETAVEATATATPAEPGMEQVVRDHSLPIITMRKLLEAGVHFGHQTRRWNPKMERYIYGARNGIYIIDLTKTVECVNKAYKKLKDIVDQGGKVLFVGTKNSSQAVCQEEALRSGSFYINNRWLGGTLTNFRTILGRIKKLKELETMEADGTYDRLSKKEVARCKKLQEKLAKNLEGIKEMRKLPQAIVVTDPTVEANAVKEARTLNIPVFAICDTSDDPELCTYPLPSNNDGANAVRLLVSVMADAIVESKGGVTEVAYVPDTAEEATMKDAIRNADIANEQRKAAIRQQRKEREERYRRMQEERAARYAARQAARQAEAAGTQAAAPAPETKKEGE